MHYEADALRRLFKRRPIVTMSELKEALGTRVDMTVFRKLREIPYLASYSHRGKYYALAERTDFDAHGLWTQGGVHFSKDGSLIDTASRLVRESERGLFGFELADWLKVEVKHPLLGLVRLRRLAREEVGGLFLYCSPLAARRRQQLAARQITMIEEPFSLLGDPAARVTDEVRAAIILFLSALDEKQRRLYAGLESLRIGRGGDRRIADWTGLDVHTVARGRRELQEQELKLGRIRERGAGRIPVEKKRPT
jgi:hypothetical protein